MTGDLVPGIPVCDTCGEQHVTAQGRPSCIAHGRGKAHPERAGRPCRCAKMTGQNVCQKHGGMSKKARAAGEARVAKERATTLATKWGVPVKIDPTEAVLGRIYEFQGLVEYYADRVREVEEADGPEGLVWGIIRETEGDVVVGVGANAMLDKAEGQVKEAKPNIWVQLHTEASRDLVKFSAEAIRAGIEERKVQFAREQGAAAYGVIKDIFTALDLTKEQQRRFAEIAPDLLRRLAPKD